MYKYFAWMCVYAPHECAVSEEARASDTQARARSCHVDTRTQNEALCKGNKCSQ